MTLQITKTLKQVCGNLYLAALGFPKYVRAGISFLLWLVIAAAALAVTYIALRGIWVAVQIALQALGIEGA